MAYEIDFVGVESDKAKKDADAICIRWINGRSFSGSPLYKVGVIDCGFEVHGDAMVNHMNQYYFDDNTGSKRAVDKTIDFMVITHPDIDHTSGFKPLFENFAIQKIYMNRPWLYVNELYEKVSDGRITKDSLRLRLREKYKTIASIEDVANEKGIPIYDAFQGTYIEKELLVLSPTKQFYLDLLVESEKTPLQETMACRQDSFFARTISIAKTYLLNLLEKWDVETLREDISTTAENESSIVMRGLIDGSSFLLTGDAGIRALNRSMDYMDAIRERIGDLAFFQIPHHGGRHNVSPSVLDRMIGRRVEKGNTSGRIAVASVAENSDHPLKMVTNAYIRRGVTPFKTCGNTLCHSNGQMPKRGWNVSKEIEFSDYVEEWDD